jgi:hypothetical protein
LPDETTNLIEFIAGGVPAGGDRYEMDGADGALADRASSGFG